ncbi:MAG: hypothetical protein Q7S84_02545 [bacterium]|nr:hypothetical protein [bacterium]
MKTKSELLKKANEEFPAYWKFLREANPHMRLPARETFPTVLGMTVGEITHEYGTEASLVLEVKTEEGETLQLTGASFENHHDTTCEFTRDSKELKQFADEFASNLIFNIMCEERIELAAWQGLPD